MMGNQAVAQSIASKMGQQVPQGGTGGDPTAQQPGTLTDSLVGALRALQTYSKMAIGADPNDPDVALVRKIMQAISMLVAKDQQEGQGAPQGAPQDQGAGAMGQGPMGMGQGSVMGGMGGGMQPPAQPDLSAILGGQRG